ncbi:hypothetical protein [Halalkalicoccus salilacus]|uniref:hypothetical protein n=1 Tax=Halalkalicoccus salilacus TaxID=3117459 RepID=UPI00300E7007
MTIKNKTTAKNGNGLHRFERNRYFHGKLMTARDMVAEQNYHTNQRRMLTRFVTGEGVVYGVDVTLTDEDGSLEARLSDGLVIDCYGVPIVVTGGGAVTVVDDESGESRYPPAGTNRIALCLRYDECVKETVPVPGAQNACEGECTYNRTLETFTLTYRPVDDDDLPVRRKTVQSLTLPRPGEFDSRDENGEVATDDPALFEMARSYNEDDAGDPIGCGECDDGCVFLGVFERTEGDEGSADVWTEMADDPHLSRSYVYHLDLLYAALSRHVADDTNPHQVTLTADPIDSDDENEESDVALHIVDLDDSDDVIGLGSLDDTITITAPDANGRQITFTTSVEQIGALRSLNGVKDTDADGEITLVSADDSAIERIEIDTQEANDEIVLTVPGLKQHAEDAENPHEVTAEQVGAITRIEGVSNPGGEVALDSPNGTISITANDNDNRIALDVVQPADPLRCVDFDGFSPSWMTECEALSDCIPEELREQHFPLRFRGVNIEPEEREEAERPEFIDQAVPVGLVKLDIPHRGSPLLLNLLSDKDGEDDETPLIKYTEVEVSFINVDNGARIILEGRRDGDIVLEDQTPLEDERDIPSTDHTYRLRLRADEAGVDGFDSLSLWTHNSTAGLIEVCTRQLQGE